MNKPQVLIITPIEHIKGLRNKIEGFASITYMPEAKVADVQKAIFTHDAIFTNPNKSDVFLGQEALGQSKRLKVICTASTGTNHIDKKYAALKGITVLALTEEREVINRISSTAEHAFALTLSALRKIPTAWESVRSGRWDYEPFVGRQFDHLVVGVIGYGRLGSYYSKYAKCFGAKVLVYDPYKTVPKDGPKQVEDFSELLDKADVISIHVHVTDETAGMINDDWFGQMKEDVLIVNTSRGDVLNENELIGFLEANPNSFYATDVIANEVTKKETSNLLAYALKNKNVLITPHIGGMTTEGQFIAYSHAAELLRSFFNKMSNAGSEDDE